MPIEIHSVKEWKLIKESQPQFYILSRDNNFINAANRIHDKKTFLLFQNFKISGQDDLFQVRWFSEDLIHIDYIIHKEKMGVEKFGRIPINNIKFNEKNHITKF